MKFLEKNQLIFLTIVLLLIVVCHGMMREYSEVLGISVITSDEYENIISLRTKVDMNPQLSFENELIPFATDLNSYLITQSNDVDYYQGKFNSYDANLNLSILKTNSKKNDLIRNGEKLHLLVYNENSYDEFTIVISGLPVISLHENYIDGENVYGDITLLQNNANGRSNEIDNTKYSCRYKIRGGTSRGYPIRSIIY